ncbi:UNVERIFIED_ORG: hypothetical protein DFO49_4063 [Herbaspirillum seropedicae]
MYDDPRKIRHRRIVVRVNDDNYDIMKALAQSYSMPILAEQNVQAKALTSHFSVPRNA